MWRCVLCSILRRDPSCFSGVFSLCSSLLSSFCPADSSYIGLFRFSALFPQFRACTGLCLASFSWYTSWKFKAVTSGNPKANLNCFLSLRDHCPFLSDVYRLKKHCFVYFTCFCLFVWFWWEGKSGLCQEQNWYAEICNILIRVLTAWNWFGGNYNAGKISYVYWFQFSKLEQGFRTTMF